jgi:Fe2+ transport system protein FeoA
MKKSGIKINGNLIVNVKNTKVALDKELAAKIMI